MFLKKEVSFSIYVNDMTSILPHTLLYSGKQISHYLLCHFHSISAVSSLTFHPSSVIVIGGVI
jgi:hypothetical protein